MAHPSDRSETKYTENIALGVSTPFTVNEGTGLLTSRFESITSASTGFPEDVKEDTWRSKEILQCVGYALSGLVLATFFLVEAVLRKILAANMLPHRWFLAQFLSIISLGTAVISYLPFSTRVERPIVSLPWRAHLNVHLVGIGVLDAVYMSVLFIGLGYASGPISCLIPQIVPTLRVALDFICQLDKPSDEGVTSPLTVSRRESISSSLEVTAHSALIVGVLAAAIASAADEEGNKWEQARMKRDTLMLLIASAFAAGSQLLKERTLSRQRLDIKKFHIIASISQVLSGFLIAPLILPLQGRHATEHKQGTHLPLPNFVSGLAELFNLRKNLIISLIFATYVASVWGGYCMVGYLIGRKQLGATDTAATFAVPFSMAIFFIPIIRHMGDNVFVDGMGTLRLGVFIGGSIMALGGSLYLQIMRRKLLSKPDDSPYIFVSNEFKPPLGNLPPHIASPPTPGQPEQYGSLFQMNPLDDSSRGLAHTGSFNSHYSMEERASRSFVSLVVPEPLRQQGFPRVNSNENHSLITEDIPGLHAG
ncbi:hypothetical protein AAMO2058_000885600 [Amorphochlora amoebiformis]